MNMDTTVYDGTPCELCGDDSSGASVINKEQVYTCDDCYHDQTESCADCGDQFWLTTMARVEDSWQCSECAKKGGRLAGCAMEALRRDEQRDHFNRSRR